MTCMGDVGCNEILTEQLHRGLHRWSDGLCVCRRIIIIRIQHLIAKEKEETLHVAWW